MSECVLEYEYRDAGNSKAYGEVRLSGEPTAERLAALSHALFDGEYFVAEKLGLPSVAHEVHDLGGGEDPDLDHELHRLVRVRAATPEDDTLQACGSLDALVARAAAVRGRWFA